MFACKRCHLPKPATEFYKHKAMANGHLSFCKSRVTVHREANLGRIQEYDRQRGRTDHRRAAVAEHQPIHRAKFPEKYVARNAVSNALRDGRINRPSECERCDNSLPLHAHHEDYSRPLDVVWLCVGCHGLRHREINEAARPDERIEHAYIEDVGPRPQEGAVGAFSFGRGCGVLEGVVAACGISYSFLRPQEWKRIMGIVAGAKKDASRSLAIRTWPSQAKTFARVKDDGRAEAALIALAGIKKGNVK